MNIEINTAVIIDEVESTIAAVKGRWVKLADGRNVSRAEAAEGADAWLEAALDADDEDLDDDEAGNPGTMSGTLLKYRKRYVKAVSYTKGATLDNGDELATALRGLSPADVCAIADAVYGEIPGSHFARYEHLNIGSRRMNAGNRIRGAIRKELVTLAQVLILTGTVADFDDSGE